MKTITLTNGKVALVSDCDYGYLRQWKWGFAKMRDGSGYARRTLPGPNRRQPLMHEVVASRKGLNGAYIDHHNGNKLDNRRSNLRMATNSQNHANEGLRRNNTSGFKGVVWSKWANKWMAGIKVNYKRIHLGYFANKHDAAKAYNQAARKFFGQYASLNKV